MIKFILLIFCINSYSQRVISLLPSYTEIIYDIGAEKNLVGVTNFCSFPPDVEKKEKVGDYLNPNIEKIYILKPDIIFAGEWKNDFIKKIKNLNAKIIIIKQEESIDDIYRTVRTISKYLNKEKEGEKIISDMKTKISSFKNKSYVKVYAEIDKDGWTVGKDSFISDVISKSGGINIFNDIKTPYFKSHWEDVIKRNPDIIILFNTSYEEFKKRPLLDKITAFKNNKIYILSSEEKDILSRPSPRIVSAIEKFSEKFYMK